MKPSVRNLGFAVPSLSAFALATSALAQTQIFELPSTAQTNAFITHAALGDVDGDGFADFGVVAATNKLLVYSGRTALTLLDVGTDTAQNESVLVAAGDMNADGVVDIAVGTPWSAVGGASAGRVKLHSGVDGAVLQTLTGVSFNKLGAAIAPLGDANGDGQNELLISVPLAFASGQSFGGIVRVYNGANLVEIQSHEGHGHFGESMAVPGDLDGDGASDWIALDTTVVGSTVQIPLRKFSGATGAELPPTDVTEPQGISSPDRVAAVGDTDGDGIGDFATYCRSSNGAGAGQLFAPAHVRSGATAALIGDLFEPVTQLSPASAVCSLGDVDGDGRAEIAASSIHGGAYTAPQFPWEMGYYQGRAWFFRGGTLQLFATLTGEKSQFAAASAADVNDDGALDFVSGRSNLLGAWSSIPLPLSSRTYSLSVASGGAQLLTLEDAAHANELYLLLGSASGTQPGVALGGGIVLPLQPDAYTNYTLAQPNHPPLSGSLGVLAAGGSNATFSLPQNSDPALVGLTVEHAFVTIDTAAPAVTSASNAVPVSLLP